MGHSFSNSTTSDDPFPTTRAKRRLGLVELLHFIKLSRYHSIVTPVLSLPIIWIIYPTMTEPEGRWILDGLGTLGRSTRKLARLRMERPLINLSLFLTEASLQPC